MNEHNKTCLIVIDYVADATHTWNMRYFARIASVEQALG
jgi:hypothetical protein